MRTFFTLIFTIFSTLLFSQSISDLERQYQNASSKKAKMALAYELGKAYLRSDAKKAVSYAKDAHERATSLKDNEMAAQASWVVSRGFNRRGDSRNEKIWLRSALNFAKQADDADMIIRSVDKLSKLSGRDYREAYQITQEAFKYFSSKGGQSIADFQAKFEMQKNKLERDRKALERERASLADEINRLKREKSNLKEDNTLLTEKQRILEKEKEQVEEAIAEKDEELAEVSEEKEKFRDQTIKQTEQISELTAKQKLVEVELEKQNLELQNVELERKQSTLVQLGLASVVLFLILLVLTNWLRLRARNRSNAKLAEQNRIIEEERKRSDELLENILPAAIAKELKETGKAAAQKFQDATVLFADFKGFTKISEMLTPEQLVKEIDDTFKAFDFIISQYADLEKIKTIGDAYMVASGLINRKTIPYNLIKAAQEMQEYLKETAEEKKKKGQPFFEARIGIHTGPVVAGVVGNKKFAYDIWGDTVNIAARMEENCEVGKVNLSETTAGLVKYKHPVKYRGKVSVKNKGMMDMYYVLN